ncbi:MAG: AAA family ATPase, partial [Thermoplasmata archaeon]|nr:AAA family ATPase [Thermoplasmata archaeon]
MSREGAGAVPLHGRATALAQIAGALDAAERGEGRLVLVVGAAGIGKSAFLAEAVHQAKGRGFRTAEAGIVARDTPVPYDLVRDLILALAHKSVEGAKDTKQSGLPLWLAAALPAGVVSGFPTVGILPEGAAPVEKRILQLLDLEGSLIDLARRLLYAELGELVRGPSLSTPLLLALDDLHHADRESLEFLRTLVSDIGRRRLILLASLDADAPARGARRSSLERLKTGPNVESITLNTLSLEDTGKAIQDRSGGTPPAPEYVRAIHLRSKGVPVAVGRWSRRWKGSIPPKDAGELEGAGDVSFQPEGIPEETLGILTCGAVIGRQFDLAVLLRALHRRSAEAIEVLLEPLVEDGTLRRRGLRRYEFGVPTVRQELYAQLPEARRRLMHRNVARALEAGESSTGPELFEIAWHYHLAAETGPSVEHNRKAAEVAVRQYAYDDARLYLERALDSLRHPSAPTPENERIVRISLGH